MLVMPLEVTNWDGSSKQAGKQIRSNRGQTSNRETSNRGQPKLTISFSIKLSKFFALKSP